MVPSVSSLFLLHIVRPRVWYGHLRRRGRDMVQVRPVEMEHHFDGSRVPTSGTSEGHKKICHEGS